VPGKEIEKWHIARGFHMIGYHYVIQPNGSIETGRALADVGAHCEGQNADSVGICLIGKDGFTWHQFNRLLTLLIELRETYDIGLRETYCHSEFPSAKKQGKTCPNINPRDLLIWAVTEDVKFITKYAIPHIPS
jgi:hypothetical protein